MYYASSHFTVFSFHSCYQGFLPNRLSVLTWVWKMHFCNLIYSMKWSERTWRVFFFMHKPRLGVVYIDSSPASLHHFRWCTQPINTFGEDPFDAVQLCFQTRASKNLIQSCPWCVIEHSGFCLLIVLIWSFKSLSDDAKIQGLSAPPVPHCLCFYLQILNHVHPEDPRSWDIRLPWKPHCGGWPVHKERYCFLIHICDSMSRLIPTMHNKDAWKSKAATLGLQLQIILQFPFIICLLFNSQISFWVFWCLVFFTYLLSCF